MEIKKNITETEHSQYEEYYIRQFAAIDLVGEKIEVLHNGAKVLDHTFTNETTYFSINLNDRSVAKRSLTIEEREQAIEEFYANHPELFI